MNNYKISNPITAVTARELVTRSAEEKKKVALGHVEEIITRFNTEIRKISESGYTTAFCGWKYSRDIDSTQFVYITEICAEVNKYFTEQGFEVDNYRLPTAWKRDDDISWSFYW